MKSGEGRRGGLPKPAAKEAASMPPKEGGKERGGKGNEKADAAAGSDEITQGVCFEER